MMFYLFLAILPCILAANDTHIECPDQSFCPIGKTCCENPGNYSCCDLSEEEKHNKKLVPGHFDNDFGLDAENNENCNGTVCLEKWCCKYKSGVCCANSTSCCPDTFKCCGTEPPNVWCCKTKQKCASNFLYCIAGASSISSTFLSMIMLLIVTVSLKHF